MEQNVLYCKIGWAEKYDGTDKKKPERGGSFNENNVGYEFYNFKKYDDGYYGFVEEPGNSKSINVSRLGVKKVDSYADDVLVVFVATKESRGQYIVGWYKNAKVYSRRQVVSEKIKKSREKTGIKYYNLHSNDAYLIKTEDRNFKINYKGRSNIYYGKDINLDEVLDYIKEIENKN